MVLALDYKLTIGVKPNCQNSSVYYQNSSACTSINNQCAQLHTLY